MRKANSEYYREFRALIEAHDPSLLAEFDGKAKESALPWKWLESLRSRNHLLWESLSPFLTDRFYFNH